MSGFSDIDLSRLPAPRVVETLSFERVLAAMRADLVSRDPAYTALLESDPALKVLEVAAYREVLLRQRVNDAARAVMLAHAVGSDLDNLAALVPLTRRVVDPGDPDALPPVPPTMESDAEFRRRVQLAPEGFSTAGPDGAYLFHALNVPGVKDAAVSSPAPGEVLVHVLGLGGNGTPDEVTLGAVRAALSAAETRPFTDHVEVRAAEIVSYEVRATLYVQPGPSFEAVKVVAGRTLAATAAASHVLGAGMALSKLYAALQVEGVARVKLVAPAADVACLPHQAAHCAGVTLEVALV
ncbi:phage-related baseplate assembly protein [Desulfobaculum xiamenense]|uniref:Phage-related baseplate assembly protein n=1 Tax=Desulfobaculum xiamenense TaxID=995050 RepID=A0A846QJG4_9BACT|nr:baseplate J/gp47 family protein [Desulfobaculum xiamenense]NJB67210.1 phage-related baseplate assembly protein [Desulfobaculum xiamenense]